MVHSGRIALTLSALLSLSLGLPLSARSAAPPIGPTDLGSLGGTIGYNYVNGMNASGKVVGGATTAGGYHAYSWTSSGGFVDLGTVKDPGTQLPWPESFAYAVNDLGQVAGTSAPGSGGPAHAVIWDAAGNITDLGLGPNGAMAWAKVINSKGWVAGEFESYTPPSGRHAFFWSSSTGMKDLGSLGGNFLTVTGMNADGVVVGVAGTAGGNSRAFSSKAKAGPLKDLGTLGGPNSSASGINDAGKIAGTADTATSGSHAFLYSNNKMTDIHKAGLGIGSSAAALNASGMVVGQINFNGGRRAFAWTSAGGMIDIGSFPGGSEAYATAVSSNGKVTGVSGASDFKNHAFLWTQAGGMVNPAPNAVDQGSFGAFINAAGQIAGTYNDLNGQFGYQKGFFIDPVLGRKNIQDHGYSSSTALDVNAGGTVVGTSLNPDGLTRGFVWSNGTMTEVPTPAGNTSDAIAINDLGQVIGHYGPPGYYTQGYVWSPGSVTPTTITVGGNYTVLAAISPSGLIVGTGTGPNFTDGYAFLRKTDAAHTLVPIVPPPPNGTGVQPKAVNDAGVVLGTFLANYSYHGFKWSESGGFIDLGTDGAAAINAAGEYTGDYLRSDGRTHAYLQGVHGPRRDLGELPGTGYSTGIGINALAQVIGYSGIRGFFYDNGMRDLGTLIVDGTTIPHALNDGGQVVGRSATQFGYHAFVWTKVGGIVDLGTLGGAESKAVKINAAGKAVGESVLADGSTHAVLWTTK